MNYPLFRLTIFMAAGIFFFDRILPDMSVVWLYIAIPILTLLCPVFFIIFKKHIFSIIPGILFSLAFFLIGGLLVLSERRKVEYEWSDEQRMYLGTVMTPSLEKGKTLCSEVMVEHAFSVNDSTIDNTEVGQDVNRLILLYYIPDSISPDTLKCGDKIVFFSKIARPVSDVDFMGFDYAGYLFRKGISGTGFVYSSMLKKRSGNEDLSIKQRALLYKEKIVDIYSKWNLDDDVMAVVSALTIGDKSELTPELKAVYSASGTSHVLALSGLHVGIISVILFFALYTLRLIRNGKALQSAVIILVLWVFAFVSGLSPSVVRAVTMCSLYMMASLVIENGFPGFFSLSLTAFIMLIYQPFYLFDVSFQLSFVAVLSILLFYPFFSSLIQSRYRIVNYLWNAVSVSMAAQLGTLPLILYYFGTFPTYFLVANLIVGPLATCILICTIASLLFWQIPVIGACVLYLLNFTTSFLNTCMHSVQQLWGAQITSVNIDMIQMILSLALIWYLYLFVHKKSASNLIISLVLMCVFGLSSIADKIKVESPAVFLARKELYIRNSKGKISMCVSPSGIYRIDTLYFGVMKDSQWSNKEAEFKRNLDYVYIARGFKGNISDLLNVFNIRTVILDSSLSEKYRKYLIEDCIKMKIPFYEISEQGSYKILL